MRKRPGSLIGALLKDRAVVWSVASTALIWCAAHLYRFVNSAFSHDSILAINQITDSAHQVAIGRFLQPLYVFLRGGVAAPYLVGILSLIWLCIAVCLIVKLLDLSRIPSIVLVSGICATWSTLSLSYATYLPWGDVFTLSLLLAVMGVWFARRGGAFCVVGSLCIMASLGLYQAYFQVAAAFMMVLLVLDCLSGDVDGKQLARTALAFLATLVAGMVLYYVVYQATLAVTGIAASSEYNSVSDVTNYSGVSIASLIAHTWLGPFEYYLRPAIVHRHFAGIANGVAALLLVVGAFQVARKRRIGKAAMAVIIAVLIALPFGMNVVYFISKGFVHELMIYSYAVPYLLLVKVIESWAACGARAACDGEGCTPGAIGGEGPSQARSSVPSAAFLVVSCLLAALVACGAIYANQAYFKKNLEYEGTLSLATRVLATVESSDGYVPGETPVLILGSFDDSAVVADREGFDQVASGVGLHYRQSITYFGTVQAYFEYILGANVNLVDPARVELTAEMIDMPLYPAEGSCKRVDGMLVVKLSEKASVSQLASARVQAVPG